jgi:hypothetical protein
MTDRSLGPGAPHTEGIDGSSANVVEHCGLRLRSEVPLPFPPSSASAWDVDVRWGAEQPESDVLPPGERIVSFGDDEDRWYTGTRTDDGYLLRFRRCGEFVISADLREVVVRPDPAGEHEILPVLLAGTCIAFLLALRGETVLHASAVTAGDGALAFVGHTGQGKTTLAALLCLAGSALISDDVLVVRPGRPVTCVGGASELRLRPSAAPLLDATAATRVTEDDRTGYVPLRRAPESHRLAALVVPVPSRTALEVRARRLSPGDALAALLGMPRVHGWRLPEVLGRDFSVLAGVVNDLAVHEVTIPWGPPFSPVIVPALLDLAGGHERSR